MIGRLLSILFPRSADSVVPEYVHAELGVFRRDRDEDCWEANVAIAGRPTTVELLVAGADAPDPALLARAVDIVRAFDSFEATVRAFLNECAADNWFGYKDEIGALVLESISLFWPARPRDAMLYFDGGLSGRVWRCNWIAGVPRDLGFDD